MVCLKAIGINKSLTLPLHTLVLERTPLITIENGLVKYMTAITGRARCYLREWLGRRMLKAKITPTAIAALIPSWVAKPVRSIWPFVLSLLTNWIGRPLLELMLSSTRTRYEKRSCYKYGRSNFVCFQKKIMGPDSCRTMGPIWDETKE